MQDCRLGEKILACPCMSDFDCQKIPGKHFSCQFSGAELIGECQAKMPPTPSPVGFGNSVIAGESDDPSLLGWHLIVIVLIVVGTCAGGAYVLYWASTGTSDEDAIDMGTSMYGMKGAGGADDSYASAMYGGGGGGGSLGVTSAYGQPDDANGAIVDVACPACGKTYNFQSDLDTHIQLRHGGDVGGGGGGGGTMNGGGTFMSGGDTFFARPGNNVMGGSFSPSYGGY
jgi:hypothetical protein